MKLFGKISYVFLLLLVIGCSGSKLPKGKPVDSLKYGMTYDEVIDLMGHPSYIETPPIWSGGHQIGIGDHTWRYFSEEDYTINGGGSKITFDDGKVIKIELIRWISSLEEKYKSLKYGMTLDQVKSELGLPYRISLVPLSNRFNRYLTWMYQSDLINRDEYLPPDHTVHVVSVEFSDGRVISIQIRVQGHEDLEL